MYAVKIVGRCEEDGYGRSWGKKPTDSPTWSQEATMYVFFYRLCKIFCIFALDLLS